MLQLQATPPFSAMASLWSTSELSEAKMTDHLEDLGRNLHSPTSRSVCKALGSSWRELRSGNAALSGRRWAEVVLEYSWEQLNTGHWEDVSVRWREVHATAALLRAVGLERAGETRRALEVLDRGILLGAPVLDSALHRFASFLAHNKATSSSLDTSAGCCDSDMPPKSEAVVSGKRGRKIVFRNYKPLTASSTQETPVQVKRLKINVHDLVSRMAKVPLIDPQCRIPLVYLPSLEVFREKHMLTHTPVVISGALDTWPAYSARKWRWASIRVRGHLQ